MPEDLSSEDELALREAEMVRELRERRDAALSPSERLARVPDLAGVLRALAAARIRFVVIGGIAVAAHRIVRATEHVDSDRSTRRFAKRSSEAGT